MCHIRNFLKLSLAFITGGKQSLFIYTKKKQIALMGVAAVELALTAALVLATGVGAD